GESIGGGGEGAGGLGVGHQQAQLFGLRGGGGRIARTAVDAGRGVETGAAVGRDLPLIGDAGGGGWEGGGVGGRGGDAGGRGLGEQRRNGDGGSACVVLTRPAGGAGWGVW